MCPPGIYFFNDPVFFLCPITLFVIQPKTPSYLLRQTASFPAAPENRFVCSRISLIFGFKGVKNKSILTFRTILYLLRQIPSKLNDLER